MISINFDFFGRSGPLRNCFAPPQLPGLHALPSSSYRRVLLVSVLIFLTATGVRLLHWHDMQTQIETGKMHFGMSDLYRADARLLLEGQYRLFVQGPNPPTNADVLTHPPGYAVWLAALFKLFGDSLTSWRFAQILIDAFTVLGVFFVARELLPLAAATIAGILAAISPQLAYTSIVLLPDSFSVLPIVWALFLIIRFYKRPALKLVIFCGALIGISCWFRANAMLLPVFLVPLLLFVGPRRNGWRTAAALIASTLIVIAPITLRNMIVFGVFLPVSLGAGITLSEGIADYDDQNRFGLLQKDHLVNQWEAQFYNRPDYAESLYASDGIFREKERTRRALAVIKANPVWFAGVMVKRVGFMMTFEQTPVVSAVPPVSHSLARATSVSPAWTMLPRDLLSSDRKVGQGGKISEEGWLILDEAPADAQVFTSRPIPLHPEMDHVLEVPIEITKGRLVLKLIDPGSRTLLASAAVPDAFQGLPAGSVPTNVLQIPFTALGKEQTILSLSAAEGEGVSAQLGPVSLFQAGRSSYTWTRTPRVVLRTFQKFFTTRKMWPVILLGVALMLLSGGWRQALTVLVVPIYYYAAHSPLHTEYRYVIGTHYFLLIFAAFAIYWMGLIVARRGRLAKEGNGSAA